MKANPGGQIDTKDIIGRDELIQKLWEIIEHGQGQPEGQSLLLTAERRIGKTCVIRKMAAEPQGNCLPIIADLEECHSANEFAERVYQDVDRFLGRWKKAARRSREFLQRFGGTELPGGLKLPATKEKHWKTLLIHSIEDLVEQSEVKQPLFLWDEVPYMLDTIAKRAGEDTAIEVLDVLRSLRQEHSTLRMVVTGSIGLHHVLASLKQMGYANSPVNDLAKQEVPPLAPADACDLAMRLIDGEELPTSNAERAGESIARGGDYCPFYVHNIVRYLKMKGWQAEPDRIEAAISEQLLDNNDPWELQHYRQRIGTYYGQESAVALAAIDCVAVAQEPVRVDDVFACVKSRIEHHDRDRLLELLKLLARDHYLTRLPDGRFTFRFPLIQRWWKLDRGL